jgi:hypothetical protein
MFTFSQHGYSSHKNTTAFLFRNLGRGKKNPLFGDITPCRPLLYLVHAGFLLGLFFDTEVGCILLLRRTTRCYILELFIDTAARASNPT